MNKISMINETKVIDLFCGVGGLTHGLVKEGLDVVAGFDIDQTCKYSYEINNNAKFYDEDVSKISKHQIKKLYGDAKVKVLVGCAPCQPFSKYAQKQKKDEKWGLLYKFIDIIEKSEPDIVSMENVPQLIKHSVYDDFVKSLNELGYSVSSTKVFCPDYGIPQNRTRLVLMASKLGPISLIDKTHEAETYITVRETIGHLPKINDGLFLISDPMHTAPKLSAKNIMRIKSSKPGGSWRDWDESLLLECHKKSSGKTYSSVYGRMEWDKPSPTMTTQCVGLGNGRFGHPEQNRAISLREAALLQTFPENYKFIDSYDKPFKTGDLARQIGNAVPVELGSVVARSIKKHLEEVAYGES